MHQASRSMHPLSSIVEGQIFKIFHFVFFENVREALEMTAHLGKGLRKGSRAELGHRRVEYDFFFCLPLFSGRRKVPDPFPRLFWGPRFDF